MRMGPFTRNQEMNSEGMALIAADKGGGSKSADGETTSLKGT